MIYVICGPTCSGKTEISKLFSDKFNAPIINADAFQIYEDMNIGTAKISKRDPYYKKHYLLDIKKPSESFSVMEYQKLFRETLEKLSSIFENIVVCGGTGLYIRASLYDYIFNEEAPFDYSELEKMSNDELYDLLKKLDPASCEKIHINNRKRVLRAIAFQKSQGMSKSENIANQSHKIIYKDVKFIFINPPRDELYEKINQRVDYMFDVGLVEEVKRLLEKYQLSDTAKAAIGYKETIDYLNGIIGLEECKELIKKRTRNYAKRQITFFKNQFELETYNSTKDIVNKYIKEV